jgi:hypothetical protein
MRSGKSELHSGESGLALASRRCARANRAWLGRVGDALDRGLRMGESWFRSGEPWMRIPSEDGLRWAKTVSPIRGWPWASRDCVSRCGWPRANRNHVSHRGWHQASRDYLRRVMTVSGESWLSRASHNYLGRPMASSKLLPKASYGLGWVVASGELSYGLGRAVALGELLP